MALLTGPARNMDCWEEMFSSISIKVLKQIPSNSGRQEFESKEEDWLTEDMNSSQMMEQDYFREFLDFVYLYRTTLKCRILWTLIPYFGIILENTFNELNVNVAVVHCKTLVWFWFLQGVVCAVFKGMKIKPGSMGKAVPLYDVQVCWLLFRVFFCSVGFGFWFFFSHWTKMCVVFHSRS